MDSEPLSAMIRLSLLLYFTFWQEVLSLFTHLLLPLLLLSPCCVCDKIALLSCCCCCWRLRQKEWRERQLRCSGVLSFFSELIFRRRSHLNARSAAAAAALQPLQFSSAFSLSFLPVCNSSDECRLCVCVCVCVLLSDWRSCTLL